SRPRQRSKNRSIDARNKPGSLNTGVMSLNVMPFFGKSGTSRTAARSLSTVSEAIGANASGLYSNVNQSCDGKAPMNARPLHGRALSRIANWERQPTIGSPSGPLFSHRFDILFSRCGCAHRHRVACESVSPDAVQFFRNRSRVCFSDSVLVDSRPAVGALSDHK